MTGWRIGYIGAPLWMAKACNKLQGQFTSGVCSIAQRAALAAIEGKDESRQMMKEAFHRRRDLICGLLKEIKGLKVRVPQGAFYVMPDISCYLGKSDGNTGSRIPTILRSSFLTRHRLLLLAEMLSVHRIA